MDKAVATAASVPLDKQRAAYKRYAEIVARDLNQLTLARPADARSHVDQARRAGRAVDFSFNTHPNWAEAATSRSVQRRRGACGPLGASSKRSTQGEVIENLQGLGLPRCLPHFQRLGDRRIARVQRATALPASVDAAIVAVPAAEVLEKRCASSKVAGVGPTCFPTASARSRRRPCARSAQ